MNKIIIISLFFCVSSLYAQNECYEKSWTLYMNGQYEDVLPMIQKCITTDSADYRLFFLLGKTQESLYKYDSAVVSFNRALKLNDKKQEIKSSLAALYLKIGQPNISANLYEQLVEANPEWETVEPEKQLHRFAKDKIKRLREDLFFEEK